MKKRLMLSLVVGVVLVSMLALTGCPKKSNDPDPLNVTGTWTITLVGDSVILTASLSHVGNGITGTVSDSVNYSVSITGETVAAAGLEKPRDITLVITYTDGRIATLLGTVSDNNKSMNGTVTDNWGGSGTWTAVIQ